MHYIGLLVDFITIFHIILPFLWYIGHIKSGQINVAYRRFVKCEFACIDFCHSVLLLIQVTCFPSKYNELCNARIQHF